MQSAKELANPLGDGNSQPRRPEEMQEPFGNLPYFVLLVHNPDKFGILPATVRTPGTTVPASAARGFGPSGSCPPGVLTEVVQSQIVESNAARRPIRQSGRFESRIAVLPGTSDQWALKTLSCDA